LPLIFFFVFGKGEDKDKDGEKRGGRNQEIERGRKNKWRGKNNCGCMLLNIELLVQVLRLWQT
jgi:hypothetical protein